MISNMLLAVAVCVCGLIDNLFIGRGLGKDALAAVGFFSPVSVAINFCYVIILGTQVLTGNLVGAGETKKVNRLFISAFATLAVIFTAFALCCLIFRESIAAILGADGAAYTLLCDYMKGYAPGILPQTLASMLTALCSFNNEIKRSYYAIGAMIVGNVLGDALLIGRLGLYGIGLASTISSTAAFLVLLPAFLKKDKLFRFQFRDGFKGSVGCYADVRVVSKNDELTVRIRDNCREFDPRKRIEMYDPDDPFKNIGLRIVSKAARQIDYYNNAGINTLIMKFLHRSVINKPAADKDVSVTGFLLHQRVEPIVNREPRTFGTRGAATLKTIIEIMCIYDILSLISVHRHGRRPQNCL